MAKRRYRMQFAGTSDAIKDLVGAFSPYNDEIMDAIESGDKAAFNKLADDRGLTETSKRALSTRFDEAVSALPSRRGALESFLKSQKDVGSLIEPEIQERIGVLGELGTIPGETVSGTSRQVDNMVEQIKGAFTSQGIGIPDDYLKEGATYAINSLRAGNYNPQQFANIIVSKAGAGRQEQAGTFGASEEGNILRVSKNVGQDIPKVYTAQVQGGQFTDVTAGPTDYSGEISTLRDMLTGIRDRRSIQGDLDELISSLPGELSRGTERMIASERENVKRTLEEELYPEIAQGLNVRGLLHGGDLPAELASAAGSAYGGVEDLYSNLLEEDDAFYRDAAFRAELQKISETEQDYAQALGGSRERALSESATRFETGRRRAQTSFEEGLYKRGLERQYFSKQEKERRLNDLQESQRQQQLLSGIITPFSQIATAGVASKFSSGRTSGGITTG